VTPELMPNLTRLMAEGASTLNARTDPAYTQTLPNHTSQFTGRSVFGASGHQVDFNVDRGTTVHAEAGTYVSSVFDVVHDNGGSTLLYAGKQKFDMMDRNWNATNGAPDLVGADDGRDKIDTYALIAPESAVVPLVEHLEADPRLEYSFFHIRDPDLSGHNFSWASPEYGVAATTSDEIIGLIVDAIEANPAWAESTAIIVVADHGGPTGGLLHYDETIPESYTIPFVVWGPGVLAGADLYALNPDNRTDPGSVQIQLGGPLPIRGHEVANLALEFLGYPSVPGSTYDQQQDLAFN
jgi:predicted AlkP superfamily pyrophosphatase or phosphodiesterase